MMLVDIPTNSYIDGMSPTLGVRQKIDSRALPNLMRFAKAFYNALGVRLVITEGSRSRPRQTMLWNLWLAYVKRGKRPPWAALAAVPFTSTHDEVKHGNATDLGSGIATFGTKAQMWAAINGPKYGVFPTGLSFVSPEPWHYDIAMSSVAGEIGELIESPLVVNLFDPNANENEEEMTLPTYAHGDIVKDAVYAIYINTHDTTVPLTKRDAGAVWISRRLVHSGELALLQANKNLYGVLWPGSTQTDIVEIKQDAFDAIPPMPGGHI